MARTRTAKAPAPKPVEIEPEDASQEEPEEETSENGQPQGKVNKAEIVRQAMAQGLDDLDDLADYIKRQHNIDIPRPQLSSYKAQQKARDRKADGGESSGRGRPRAAAPPSAIPVGFTADIATLRALIIKAGGTDALLEILEGPLPVLAGKYGQGGLVELIRAIG